MLSLESASGYTTMPILIRFPIKVVGYTTIDNQLMTNNCAVIRRRNLCNCRLSVFPFLAGYASNRMLVQLAFTTKPTFW